MFRKRGLSCALLIGLGASLAGCAPQPTLYSGAYYGPHGPVYNGLYYVGSGPTAWAYSGGYNAWPFGFGGDGTPPYYSGPYYAGYYWRHGYPHRRLHRYYPGG